MISYTFKCDRCGKELPGAPIVLFPETIDRDDPTNIISEASEIEDLREEQAGRTYCKACVKSGLQFINTPIKRGRPKKEDA